MKISFLILLLIASGLSTGAAAQTAPAAPRRIDFQAKHIDTVHVNPVAIPYTAGPSKRIDFNANHFDIIHTTPASIPYSPGPSRRLDFQAPHIKATHKE